MIRLLQRRTASAVLTASALALAMPPAATGQQAPNTTRAAAPAATAGEWGAADIAPRPAAGIVSVTMVFPAGSAGDPAGAPGAAWMFGRVARETALAGLDPAARASTEIAVEVGRSVTTFRMATLPRYWQEAYGVLEWAVLRADPPSGVVERIRADMESVFLFEMDAPHREFEEEFYRHVGSSDLRWSRPPGGRAEIVTRGRAAALADSVPGIREGDLHTSLHAVDGSTLAAFRTANLRKSEAVVSVLGNVEAVAAARTVTGGPALPPGGVTAPGFRPLRAEDEAWESGERLLFVREVTSTWVGVGWPVDEETPRIALEMLTARLDETFNSDPPDPGSFSVDVRVEPLGARDILIVEAAVLPEAADQWEARIRNTVAQIAAAEVEGPYFRADRRRFRAARLLADAPPEVEGLRRAMDLLREGRIRDLGAEIAGLVADDLQEAAADLGEARVVRLGPDIGDGSSW